MVPDRTVALLDKFRSAIDGYFVRGEARGKIIVPPVFFTNYADEYPELKIFEENQAIIREECINLLNKSLPLPNIDVLAGDYTQSALHYAKWKVFTFRIGKNIPANCVLAPKTAEMINKTPGIFTAFFSILHPKQQLVPHWGYYKGFLRYHLGVIIPKDNQDNECWLRINDDKEQNARCDKNLVSNGKKYFWKNGQGLLFDDTYLHDAANETDEIRVVLWLDIYRRMPFPYNIVNRLILAITRQTGFLKRSRAQARLNI